MKTRALFFPFDLFGHSGTRQGPELLADAVREMLADNRREKIPTRARCYTNKVQVEELVLDALLDYADWQSNARLAIAEVFAADDFLLWTAGNHLGVLPLYDELANDPKRTVVVQFDAHLDIYNLADCTTELSHGNFLRHVDGRLPTLINLGHREQVLRSDAVSEYFAHAFAASEIHRESSRAVAAIREACAGADRVIIDLDCDVFDAAYFPGIAQPEPFGLSPAQVLTLLEEIWSPKIRGVAISEFFPSRDDGDRSLATLVWLVEWVLLKTYERPVGASL